MFLAWCGQRVHRVLSFFFSLAGLVVEGRELEACLEVSFVYGEVDVLVSGDGGYLRLLTTDGVGGAG